MGHTNCEMPVHRWSGDCAYDSLFVLLTRDEAGMVVVVVCVTVGDGSDADAETDADADADAGVDVLFLLEAVLLPPLAR